MTDKFQPIFTDVQQLRGTSEPAEVRHRRKQWLLILIVPIIIMAVACLVGYIYVINKGVGEVRQMGRWPSSGFTPSEIIPPDLSHLGLVLDQVQEAREEETWAAGSYKEGIMVTYAIKKEPILAVWALRYPDSRSAGNDYNAARTNATSPGVCGVSLYGYFGKRGMITCQFSNFYQKLLWNDQWIINITAMDGAETPPEVLVNQVLDAIAAHWTTLPER